LFYGRSLHSVGRPLFDDDSHATYIVRSFHRGKPRCDRSHVGWTYGSVLTDALIWFYLSPGTYNPGYFPACCSAPRRPFPPPFGIRRAYSVSATSTVRSFCAAPRVHDSASVQFDSSAGAQWAGLFSRACSSFLVHDGARLGVSCENARARRITLALILYSPTFRCKGASPDFDLHWNRAQHMFSSLGTSSSSRYLGTFSDVFLRPSSSAGRSSRSLCGLTVSEPSTLASAEAHILRMPPRDFTVFAH